MTPHQLGQELRQLVQRQRRLGQPMEPRQLQAAVGDLCGSQHGDLVAPLRALVLSAPFASAAGQDPPLADGRVLVRLQQELAEVYSAPLCARLQPVLEGLLGLGEGAGSSPPAQLPIAPPRAPDPSPLPAAAPVSPVEGAPIRPPGPPPASSSALTGLLAFLSGVLLMAVAGLALLLWQRQQPARAPGESGGGTAALPAPASPPAPVAVPASPDPAPAEGSEPGAGLSPGGEPDADAQAQAVDRAVGTVQELYGALSARDAERARALFAPAVADQFEPSFFDQFARVTVQNLRVTSRSGSTVNLEGELTFVYPDGSLQRESRTFSVDAGGEQPLITASEFGRVIQPR